MIRMSRIGMIAVLLFTLLLVACDQNVDDVLDDPESTTPSGEVIVGTETTTPGEEGVAAAGEDTTATAPAAEGEASPAGGEGVESGGGLGTGTEGAEPTAGAEAPSTPAAEDNSGTALMTPEPEETTVSIGATPEITATASTDVGAAAEATPEPAAPPAPTTYTVVAGDTLFSIAQRFNTTVDELRALNPTLQSSFIFVGQQITVPGQAEAAPAAPAGEQRTHTVQAGEWIYAIARQYNVSPEDIMRVNGLTSEVIQPGQVLIIP